MTLILKALVLCERVLDALAVGFATAAMAAAWFAALPFTLLARLCTWAADRILFGSGGGR